MSGSVDSSISESVMTENMGVEVGIAAPPITGQKLFQLPVFASRHLEFWWSAIVYQRRSPSGSVTSVKSKSGVVEIAGVGVGIMSACCWQTEVTSTSRKSSSFPWRVPLVFQVASGNVKSHVHTRNPKTSEIGPSRNGF